VEIGRGIALVSCLLVGCGTVHELLGVIAADSGAADADGSGADSGGGVDAEADGDSSFDGEAGTDSDAEAGTDAQDAAAPCDPAKPFGAPAIIAELQSSGTEGGLRLLPDELTGFFWSTRTGGPGTANLYVTTRPDRASPFGGVALLNNVNATGTFQLDPTPLPNGLTLVFRSIRADSGAGGDDLYSAARANAGADFAQPTPIASLNSTSNDVQPFVTADGSEVYYASDRTGNYDIYRAAIQGGVYGAPAPVTELNQAGVDDADPVLSADRLTIFFASTRPGGQGASDIWTATRTSTAAAFGAPTNVAELNSTAQDDPTWLSADGCRLYMSIGPMPATHIYLATRPQ
jgi:hypothetical protein